MARSNVITEEFSILDDPEQGLDDYSAVLEAVERQFNKKAGDKSKTVTNTGKQTDKKDFINREKIIFIDIDDRSINSTH